ADRSSDRKGRRDEQEFIDAVGGGLLGQILHVEDLAHGHAHDRDRDPVPGLVDPGLRLVGTHLTTPGVARERGQLRALDPFQRLERKPRRVASGITIPASCFELGLHLSRANDDKIAALKYDALLFRCYIEIGAGDAVTILEYFFAKRARHVEENTAADHLRFGLLDAALLS